MIIFLQFLFLITTAFAIISIIKKQWVAIIVSIALSFFITMEIVSYSLVKSLIDYRFYEHMDIMDVWSVKDFYSKEIISGLITFVIVFAILFMIFRIFRNKKIKLWIPILIIVTGILVMSITEGGILKNISQIYAIKNAKDTSFDAALTNLKIDPVTYVKPEQITAEPGKNIIVISLESLERGFLTPPINKLTPTLSRLSKKHSFYEMQENSGSNWTVTSIYTSITGIPGYFRSPTNETFQNTKISNIGNLGNVLQAAGYDMTYLIAKKEFSGLNDMLRSFGFTVKSEADLDVPHIKGFWGLQDKELFEEATKEILTKSKTDKPFALFLNTISGHFPEGVYDERMEGILPPQNSKLEFMTAAVDHYIGNLFDVLERENLLESTVVYIYPDHSFMGDLKKTIKEFPKKRGLYLISTAPEEELGYDTDKPLTQIDIPRIIINGAHIKTNATFLTDYLKGKNRLKFIKKNIPNFLALNEPSIKSFDYSNEIRLSINGDNTLTISQEDDYSHKVFNIKENTLYRIYFDKNMTYIKCKDVNKDEAFWRGGTAGIVFSVTNKTLHTYLLKGKVIGIAREGESEVVFNKKDLTIFEKWQEILPEKVFKANKLYLKSVGYNALNERMSSYIKTGLEDHKIGRGLNILTLQHNVYVVNNYDTYDSKEETEAFIKDISLLLDKRIPFAIIAHDSAERMLKRHEEALESLGLILLKDIKKREAYVAYSTDKGYAIEEVDENVVTVELPLNFFNKKLKKELKRDRSRFIAHGGGKIDGKLITNTIESLDLSYKNGFRYFELDILETSDKNYVAAHDWKTWSTHTGYKGAIPPTTAEFLQMKVHGKYTLMDMKAINKWFKEHPDAILITDKINDPVNFSKQFIDKNRLMMELFTVDAIKKALPLQLKGVLASNVVLRKFKGEEIEKIRELGIKYLAVSRKFVAENKPLFIRLKEEGIITYVYNVNFEKGKDEVYVFDYEIGLVHGMYADIWTFPEETDSLKE